MLFYIKTFEQKLYKSHEGLRLIYVGGITHRKGLHHLLKVISELEKDNPFGFGLSYTTFAYADVKATPQGVSLTVTNTGDREGAEIVQVYVAKPDAKIFRPAQELNCVWVAVAGLLVPDFIYNIGTTVLNGGISMVIFFFVNKIIFPESGK